MKYVRQTSGDGQLKFFVRTQARFRDNIYMHLDANVRFKCTLGLPIYIVNPYLQVATHSRRAHDTSSRVFKNFPK